MTAVEKLCTFSVDGNRYGVDVTRVQEVLGAHAITRVPLAPQMIGGLINLRGQIVTMFDMRRCCGLPPPPAASPSRMGVVVHTDGRAVCLLVDEIGDVVSVHADTFDAVPDTVPAGIRRLILGAYKLADTLVLAIDIDLATRLTAD